MAFDAALQERIERARVIAVVTIDRSEHAVPLARALVEGGVHAIELTLRTPTAMDALRAVAQQVPDMIAGVGTVLTPELAVQAKEAGAAFGVAPGTNPRVVQAALSAGLTFIPGVATPSDIERALELGCRLLKFFPAEASGGLAYLKQVSVPYQHLGLRFIPLQGVNASNMASYLADAVVAAIGGSWIAPRDDIEKKNWAAITLRAREAKNLASGITL